ncbi:MAG TPA: hydantoinase B/oxoprolinase family protein [Candidatus Binatia bacterium]|nr:hydantoinase B/oxoprolinase family protein [Candidatus Binatia bacterium]
MATETQCRELSRTTLDPALLAVLANRFEAIVREMTQTLLRAGRSAAINIARDFSCSITTNAMGQHELLAAAEGLPVHIYGSHLQAQAMCDLHPDLREGDAFLHNDPYLGNSHPADHTILVPVFWQGEPLFTAVAKAHLSDIGNALPTSYMPYAQDVYEEGALLFPCVLVQRAYKDIDDIIRLCRKRIRVPEQWYGDYLAMLGAARVGERRIKDLLAKYGPETIKAFVQEWFQYSERRMIHAIKRLPGGVVVGTGRHDPFPGLPDGLALKAVIDIDAEGGWIEVDLRDNPDNVAGGANSSEACSISSVMQGIFSVLGPDIPHNAGSFRRVRVKLREGCVVGVPRFPHSCSLATTNPANRLVGVTQSAFAEFGDGWGTAEGGIAQNAGYAVISGTDARRNGAAYVNQMILGNNGGPASAVCDGWVTYGIAVISGLLYRDSIEIAEQKYPLFVKYQKLAQDGGGPGRFRGAPAIEVQYGPKIDPVTFTFPMEGYETPAKGVRGGLPGSKAWAVKLDRGGNETPLPNIFVGRLLPGEFIRSRDCGGGGYGPPVERDPEYVRRDVLERWVSLEQAKAIYGVVFTGNIDDETLVVDRDATRELRERLRQASN